MRGHRIKTTVITIKLTDLELQVVDQLIAFHNYKSRSDVLRKALNVLALDKKIEPAAVAELTYQRRLVKPRKRPDNIRPGEPAASS